MKQVSRQDITWLANCPSILVKMRSSCIPMYASYLGDFFLLGMHSFLNTMIICIILWNCPLCCLCSNFSFSSSSISPSIWFWEETWVFLEHLVPGECSVKHSTGLFHPRNQNPAERCAQEPLCSQAEMRQRQGRARICGKSGLTHSTTSAVASMSLQSPLFHWLMMASPVYRGNILVVNAHFLHALPTFAQ